jgi:DNA gyrase/topoisomerase IV subunit B
LCKYRGKVYFGETKEAIYKQAGTTKLDIRHIKGWGEIEPEDMREIAFNPKTRKLIQVMPPKDKSGSRDFTSLMGKDSGYRKKLLGV